MDHAEFSPQDTTIGVMERAKAMTDRAAALIACQEAGRHGPAGASIRQIQMLPTLRTNDLKGGTWRYCQMCWTVFMPSGRRFDESPDQS